MPEHGRDPWDDPQVSRWTAHVRHQLVPMIRGSTITACLNPGDPDVKAAVELGYMILLDKPIAVFTLGRPLPDKLRAVADVVIDGNPSDPAARAAFIAFLKAHDG